MWGVCALLSSKRKYHSVCRFLLQSSIHLQFIYNTRISKMLKYAPFSPTWYLFCWSFMLITTRWNYYWLYRTSWHLQGNRHLSQTVSGIRLSHGKEIHPIPYNQGARDAVLIASWYIQHEMSVSIADVGYLRTGLLSSMCTLSQCLFCMTI